MRYKAEYQPSSLLDPATNEFYPWAHCKRRLDLDSHASFSRPLNPSPSPPSAAIPIPGSDPTALNEARESTSRVGTPASGMEVESEEEDEVQWPDHPPPGCLDPGALPKSMILGTCLLEGRTLVPLMVRFGLSSIRCERLADAESSFRRRGMMRRERRRFAAVWRRWGRGSKGGLRSG